MKILFILIIMIGSFVSISAQKIPPSEMTPAQTEEFRRRENTRVNQSFENLGKLTDQSGGGIMSFPIERIDSFKISAEQKTILSPLPEDSAKFKSFLVNSKTGLIKIFPDLGCESKYVVNVANGCENWISGSSFYSFRRLDYTDQEFADLRLKDNYFVSDGFLSQGILVSLGDVPIENLSLNSNGFKFLVDYKPPKKAAEAIEKSKEVTAGIKSEDFYYSDKIAIKENITYAIRVIAYRKRVSNFFDYAFNDVKRKDIITVFRVVRVDKDGIVTLLWKELQRKDAPEIEVLKKN